jgi:pimeloyl-ACP methyl ester carboxylesterase
LSDSSNLGTELFRLIYPYYVGNKSAILPIDVPFNTAACNSIAAQVNEFDDLKLIENTGIPMVRIVGCIDPFYTDPDAMKERTIVLKEVGHYPFFEDPSQFNTAVLELEEIVCQTTMPIIQFS